VLVDPAGARFLTLASLRWVIRHRAWTPWFLIRYLRFARCRLANPGVIIQGMVWLDRGARLSARPGYGRLIIGPWVHVGAGTSLRSHEGTLRVGERAIFARHVSVNCYLDIEIGASAMIADYVYISDFDHRFEDHDRPIRLQGIAKSRVRIGRDVWLGTKVTVARGAVVGDHAVVGANAVVTRDIPAYAVAVGVPARVIRDRREPPPAQG
jgi:acetyltransferase-like isoleucine patch superfamily enzyme